MKKKRRVPGEENCFCFDERLGGRMGCCVRRRLCAGLGGEEEQKALLGEQKLRERMWGLEDCVWRKDGGGVRN